MSTASIMAAAYGALYDFIDIDQIDVIPSAQGTLFGRNSVDGAILITTKQPGEQFAATGDITYGTKNWLDVRARRQRADRRGQAARPRSPPWRAAATA